MYTILVSHAIVNVKTNMQTIEDGSKCFHGAAISDREESLVLCFQAHDIEPKAARRVLLSAFGGELIERLHCSSIGERVQSQIKMHMFTYRSHRHY